jgi:hypothetical protein
MGKLLVVDMDTPIVKAAAVCQNNLKVVHIPTGEAEWWPSKKQFTEKCKGVDLEEYEFLEEPALIDLGPDADIRWRGQRGLKAFIEELERLPWVDDIKLVIGGKGNFRDAVAKTWPYKGNRGAKPILTEDMREYVRRKWPDKCLTVDGIEADDVVGHFGYASYLVAKESNDPKKAPTVIAHVDKDINIIPGWHYNFNSKEVYWVSEKQGLLFFFKQMLYGDKVVDFVPGLNAMSPEILERWSLRKVRGMGEGTAQKIIDHCPDVKMGLEAVIFCYKSCYPDTWKEYIQEQSDLLWMQRVPDSMYSFEEAAKHYGIDW